MGYNEFLFLLRGLQWTLALSAVGFVCGSLTGLVVALARTSRNRLLMRATAGYIAGGPALVQIDSQLTRLEQERDYALPR